MQKNVQQKENEWKVKEIAKQRSEMRKDYVASPAAGPGILACYKKYFLKATEKKNNPKVLVLGATPELRDMVLEQNYGLITVDISPEMIEKMNSIMKYQHHLKETIIQENWLSMRSLQDDSVDFVMGDGISANIPFDKQDSLFGELKRLLKPNGHLLLRERVILPEKKTRPVKEIVEEWRKENLHWFDLWSELYAYSPLTYNPNTKTASVKELSSGLKKARKEGILNKQEFETMWRWKGNLTNTVLPQKEFEDMFSRHFKLLATEKPKDFKFCDSLYFFFGKVRK